MQRLIIIACACACAARAGTPPTPRCLSESELDGYCRRRLDGEGLEPAPANGTAPPVSVNADGQFLAMGLTRSGTDSTTSTSTAGPVRGSRT